DSPARRTKKSCNLPPRRPARRAGRARGKAPGPARRPAPERRVAARFFVDTAPPPGNNHPVIITSPGRLGAPDARKSPKGATMGDSFREFVNDFFGPTDDQPVQP